MKQQYLMGNDDGIRRTRKKTFNKVPTRVSNELYKRLLATAIENAIIFYHEFFDIRLGDLDFKDLVASYQEHFEAAKKYGLFSAGGVREKDHLNFWCCSIALNPSVYVESGVYIGSSLHAFLNNSNTKRIIAIDPRLDFFKIDRAEAKKVEFIDEFDFSELSVNLSAENAVAYFDDHINCAERIVQSFDKGIRYIIFDDSTGLEGVCQRLYPPVPTIPMIMNNQLFEVGDTLTWRFIPPKVSSGIFRQLYGAFARFKSTDVEVQFTELMLAQCQEARSRIKKVSRLPDLGYYLPQSYPEKMVDTTKYIVELAVPSGKEGDQR